MSYVTSVRVEVVIRRFNLSAYSGRHLCCTSAIVQHQIPGRSTCVRDLPETNVDRQFIAMGFFADRTSGRHRTSAEQQTKSISDPPITRTHGHTHSVKVLIRVKNKRTGNEKTFGSRWVAWLLSFAFDTLSMEPDQKQLPTERTIHFRRAVLNFWIVVAGGLVDATACT